MYFSRPSSFRLRLPITASLVAAALTFALPAAAEGEAEPISPELAARLAKADVKAGEKLYKRRCRACHTNTPDGDNKTGPNLWNIVGRYQGAAEGFRYSEGLKSKGGHWGHAELDAFLTRPADYVDDIRMAFPGLKKASDRANLIAYLRTLSDEPTETPLN